jgi:gliding motility associated protien GldN
MDVGDIKPYFNLPPMPREMIPTILNTDRTGELGDGDIATSEYMLLNYDSTTQEMRFNNYSYKGFARNQLKYMVQEVIFFNKHYSRLYSKILAIAPMHSDNVFYYDDMPIMEALYGQILFWIPFDYLRPYMAQQYMVPTNNDTKRVTFDDFFAKKLYTSYIVGASNVHNRMIPDYSKTREEIKKEQDRIEWELLCVEQDLWEY